MNQLILSFLRRQTQQSFHENSAETHVDYPFWQPSDEYCDAEQDASVSSSLVPLQYHTLRHPENWQHTSFTHQSSHNMLVSSVSIFSPVLQ